jgi:hypothetical protein
MRKSTPLILPCAAVQVAPKRHRRRHRQLRKRDGAGRLGVSTAADTRSRPCRGAIGKPGCWEPSRASRCRACIASRPASRCCGAARAGGVCQQHALPGPASCAGCAAASSAQSGPACSPPPPLAGASQHHGRPRKRHRPDRGAPQEACGHSAALPNGCWWPLLSHHPLYPHSDSPRPAVPAIIPASTPWLLALNSQFTSPCPLVPQPLPPAWLPLCSGPPRWASCRAMTRWPAWMRRPRRQSCWVRGSAESSGAPSAFCAGVARGGEGEWRLIPGLILTLVLQQTRRRRRRRPRNSRRRRRLARHRLRSRRHLPRRLLKRRRLLSRRRLPLRCRLSRRRLSRRRRPQRRRLLHSCLRLKAPRRRRRPRRAPPPRPPAHSRRRHAPLPPIRRHRRHAQSRPARRRAQSRPDHRRRARRRPARRRRGRRESLRSPAAGQLLVAWSVRHHPLLALFDICCCKGA